MKSIWNASRGLLDTAAREKIQWDEAWLGYALNRRLGRMADELAVNPREERLQRFNAAVGLVRTLPFEVNLAPVQNVFYQLLQNVYPAVALEGGRVVAALGQRVCRVGPEAGSLRGTGGCRDSLGERPFAFGLQGFCGKLHSKK